jgi:hypothetical protein
VHITCEVKQQHTSMRDTTLYRGGALPVSSV